jgi:hypothetical protein
MFPRALGEETTSALRLRLRGAGPRAILALVVGASLVIGLAACGDDEERQDADEPAGEFPVNVTEARFPTNQRLAQTSDLRLAIENIGEETVPDLAVTIYTGDEKAGGPFDVRSDQPGLADPNRPVWILESEYPKLLTAGLDPDELDQAPTAGAEAAQTNTFSFGPLPPGESKDIVWRVTPVQPDTYTVHYEVAAGLQGKAKAVTGDGSPVEGEFVVTITDKPPKTCVGDSGEVLEASQCGP